MAKKRKIVELDLDERLRDSEHRATSMSLPVAVQHRLDVLAERADAISATRAEIIGMLIAEAEVDADRLEAAILRYRKKLVGDVIPEMADSFAEPSQARGHNVIALERRGPGRPGRKAG